MTTDPMTRPPGVDPSAVAIASAVRAINLGVLGAGTLGAVGLALAGDPMLGVMVLALGVLAYGALIGLDMFNPAFIRQVSERGGTGTRADGAPGIAPEAAPENGSNIRPQTAPENGSRIAPAIGPDAIEPEDLRATYQAILASYAHVRDAVAAGGDVLRRSVTEALERCAHLVREAGQMARRGNALHRYLGRARPRSLEADAERLESQARATRDQAAAESFRQAAQARRQQIETYLQIEGLYDRIQAQLSVIQTAIDGVHAGVVKVSATDPEQAATVGASLSDHLGGLQTDMQILETTVDETIKELSL